MIVNSSTVAAVQSVITAILSNFPGLQDSDHKFISGKAALSVHAQLVQDLAAAEAMIAARNTEGKSKSGTISEGGLPYQLLIPSGVDGEGEDCSYQPHSTLFLMPLVFYYGF